MAGWLVGWYPGGRGYRAPYGANKRGSVSCSIFFFKSCIRCHSIRPWIFEWSHTPLFGGYLEVKLKISEIIYQRWLNGFQTELTNFNYQPDISILTSPLLHAFRVTTPQHQKIVFLGQCAQYSFGKSRNLQTPDDQYFLGMVSIIVNTCKAVILIISLLSIKVALPKCQIDRNFTDLQR